MSLDLILSSLGWALLHSIWQGFLAAGVVYTLRATFKSLGASLRYSFQFLCLVACLVAFVVTFGIYAASGLNGASATSVTTSFTEIIQLGKLTLAPATEAASTVSYTEILQKSSPLIGAVWILGFIIVSLRCAISFQMTQALRKSGLSPAPQHWENRFRTLVLNAGLPRMAKIFISDKVTGPLTLGFFKPIVLVPASFFTQLPKDQIEAVLLHEIAHIRRHDYLLNILQTAIKAVFFYHPGIHYISRRINEDREYACDDFSVNETKNPKALAKALAALRLQHPENSFAMAANGKSSPMLARLQRLVKAGPQRRERGQASVPAIALLLSTAIYFSVAPMSEAHPTPDPQPDPRPSYNHAKHKLQNYSFDVVKHEGRPVTVKVTEDGRRWVLVDGAWHDVDKRPDMLRAVPVMPTAPVPPVPPVIAGVEHAGSKTSEKAMRKFEKQMDQFEIDMDYFEKSMENWSKDYGKNFNEDFGTQFAENFGTEFAETFSEEFSGEWSDEFRKDFEDNFAKDSSENYNKSFEFEGEDTEASDDHPGSEHENAAKRAAEKRARMIERAEEKREKILAQAQERAEEQREDTLERMEDEREEAMERMEEQREAALERMEEQREDALDRAEDQRERAQERMEREQERAVRAQERAERDAERAKRNHDDHTSLRKDLMKRLMKDGMISSTSDKVAITYKNDHWVVNGTQIPSSKAGNYCDLFADNGIQKSSDIKVIIKPDSMQVATTLENGSNRRVTYGTFEHDEDKHNGQHKNANGEWHADHAAISPTPSFTFITPVKGAQITARNNEKFQSVRHHGVDLAVQKGAPVYASASGEVDKISTNPSWGNRIVIEHKDGFHTVYASLDSFNVKVGQKVKAGDVIGKVGNTADVTLPPHLHFEIRHSGKLIDPEEIIPAF